MSSNIKTFSFAFITCVICSVLLTAAATGLKPMQERNIKIDKQKNILKALGLYEKGQDVDVSDLYSEKVKDKWVSPSGEISETKKTGYLPLHVLEQNGVITAYAMPTSGYGLWSTLYGYVALKGDGTTIQGFTIYSHKETPGLGGEADKPWFQNQFKDKRIVNENGEFVSVTVLKGKVKDSIADSQTAYYVDGMSGATITTKGIDSFLRKDLSAYEPFSSRLRGGN